MRIQVIDRKGKRYPNKKTGKRVVTVTDLLLHGILLCGVLLSALPVLLILSVSFSSEASILSNGYAFIPKEFSLSTYRFLFREPSVIFRAYGVTILTTVLSTLLGLATVALFAYPLSRREYRFSEQITFFMFFTMLFSGGLVAYYIVMTGLFNMRDNLLAMILPFGFNAFWVIVMRTFYRTQIPDSLVESARIDGAGEWRTLVQIVLPLSVPGLATIALFTALAVWNDWFNCMLFVSRTDLSNLQTMIYRALRSVQMLRDIMAKIGSAGVLADAAAKMPSETFRMALCVVAIGPIILAYPFFQKYFIRGLSVGAVKG